MKKSRSTKKLDVSESVLESEKVDGNPALVPKLRFPEFFSADPWCNRTIEDVCKLKAGEFISASEIADGLAEGWFPCFGGNGLRGYVQS